MMLSSRMFQSISLRHRVLWRLFSSKSEAPPQHESLLRFDMIQGSWVLYSSGRKNRPQQTDSTPTKICLHDLPRIVEDCPFCAGNEHMTPKARLVINSMRVVDNKYPAVAPLKVEEKHQHQMPFLINDGVLTNNQVPAVGFQ